MEAYAGERDEEPLEVDVHETSALLGSRRQLDEREVKGEVSLDSYLSCFSDNLKDEDLVSRYHQGKNLILYSSTSSHTSERSSHRLAWGIDSHPGGRSPVRM